jgi:hypothetical protein
LNGPAYGRHMHKLNILLVAVLVAGAAVLGTYAALRTTSLGVAHRTSADTAVRVRTRQLDRFAAALHKQLAQQTPALPAVPARRAAPPAPTARVVYRRPPPIVVVHHTHHGDDGGNESEGRDD